MRKKQRILVIDDEPDFVEALRRTLSAKSYRVITASSKEQAQEMVKEEPALVILGTLAPAGQAFSMYQWLGQHPRYKDVPLLAILVQVLNRTDIEGTQEGGMTHKNAEFTVGSGRPGSLNLLIDHNFLRCHNF